MTTPIEWTLALIVTSFVVGVCTGVLGLYLRAISDNKRDDKINRRLPPY